VPVALLLGVGVSLGAAPLSFDRVDLISEDPGLWLNYDVPLADVYWPRTGYRFLEQVKPVWHIAAVEGLYVGASLRSQSLVYEGSLGLGHGLYWTAGLQTALLLPRGALAGLAWRGGPFRIGVGVSLLTAATWSRPDWSHGWLLPTLGFGVGPAQVPPRD
jgi:hypothetical protein